MSEQPSPQPEPDPHLRAALEEEQQLLDRAIQAAQAQHLMNRCIELNAAARRSGAVDQEEPDPS